MVHGNMCLIQPGGDQLQHVPCPGTESRATAESRAATRSQYGFDGIMSQASRCVTLAGPPLEKSVTPRLSSRDG